jgi:hypothetical protein
MSTVRVAGFSASLDGFGAGIEQSLGDPLCKRGTEIFQWFFHTKSASHSSPEDSRRKPDSGLARPRSNQRRLWLVSI